MSAGGFAGAASVEVSEIPVIDIAPLLSGGDVADVAAQMHRAAAARAFFRYGTLARTA